MQYSSRLDCLVVTAALTIVFAPIARTNGRADASDALWRKASTFDSRNVSRDPRVSNLLKQRKDINEFVRTWVAGGVVEDQSICLKMLCPHRKEKSLPRQLP